MDANIEARESLNRNLIEYGVDPTKLLRVVQYNKRDRPSALLLTQLGPALNPTNVPSFEAVAPNGVAVFDTLKGITKLVLAVLQHRPEHARSALVLGASSPARSERQILK